MRQRRMYAKYDIIQNFPNVRYGKNENVVRQAWPELFQAQGELNLAVLVLLD